MVCFVGLFGYWFDRPGEDAQGVARSGVPRAAPDQSGSASATVFAPLHVVSRASVRFLALVVLRLKRIDSLPVSTMWQWCVKRGRAQP